MKMYDTPQPVEPKRSISAAERWKAFRVMLQNTVMQSRIFCVTKSLGRLPGNAVKNC